MKYALQTIRHSAAHVLAAAIQRLHPEALFGVGPATDDGFYYDVFIDPPLNNDDLARIEKEMRRIVREDAVFQMSVLDIQSALEQMGVRGQRFKVELLELLRDKGTTVIQKDMDEMLADDSPAGVKNVSFYTVAGFEDLCRGPHVETTGDIKHFKLMNLAGAYWRGDSKREQMQRIYGTVAESEQELEDHIQMIQERRRRDHRRLGKDLGLFRFSDSIGPGLPIWLPKGNIIRQEIEQLANEYETRAGYKRVTTPILAKEEMYLRSGHLPYYAGDMYAPIEIEENKYYLRPMNCPHHHEVFLAEPRSYRDLPYRVTEYGHVFRYEASGGLSGLMRTRGFCQNDAHIYCMRSQAKDEFVEVMRLHERYYRLFGIEKFYMRLSLPDMARLDKYVDQPDEWRMALEVIREAMVESKLDFIEAEGEAAFYGPKVDFMIRSATGIEYAISTNQLDFLAAQRFNLAYVAPDGRREPVYVIHRAPLGSHERFAAFLIEHFAGEFPTWLAPQQIVVIPVAERHGEYAQAVVEKLHDTYVRSATGSLRAEADLAGERMQKKIRTAEGQKIPYICVVGDDEVNGGGVSVRSRGHGNLGFMTTDRFFDFVRTEVETRALPGGTASKASI